MRLSQKERRHSDQREESAFKVNFASLRSFASLRMTVYYAFETAPISKLAVEYLSCFVKTRNKESVVR